MKTSIIATFGDSKMEKWRNLKHLSLKNTDSSYSHRNQCLVKQLILFGTVFGLAVLTKIGS